MAFYSYIFSANYKKFDQKLKVIAKREHRSHFALTINVFYSILRYGIGLSDYLNYEFYKKSAKEKKEYAGIKIQDTFYELVSPSAYKKRYTIKPDFLADFKKYTKRDFIVPKENNFKEFEAFIKKHNVFMSKPYDGLGGADVLKVNRSDIKDVKRYFEDCIKNRIFLEEVVTQHKDMNKLCPTSCNTIRIMTFHDHGKPEILWACLRVGNGIHAVDNFHAGGMGVQIDLETGKLIGKAIDKDLREYDAHPVTKVLFDGFQLPFFKELKQMVLEASLESDKILLVGWDVAITPDGPLIIEGNRRPGFDIVQVVSRVGRMDIIRDVTKRVSKEK